MANRLYYILNIIDESLKMSLFWIIKICYYLLVPVKLLLKLLTNYFQRPYSLFFLIDFFLLMTSNVLLVIILIQNKEFINSLENFNNIFYFTLVGSVINYVSVFHIYHLYGLHSLHKNNFTSNIKSYLYHIIRFSFKNSIVGYIALFFIFESIYLYTGLKEIQNSTDFFTDKFPKPIVIDFTIIAIILNLIFCLIHILFFTVLVFCILFKINKSCFIGLVLKLPKKNDKDAYPFYDLFLNCFEFLGIYSDESESSISQNIENV